MSQEGILDVTDSHPSIPTTFVANSGTATPVLNTLNLFAAAVAAGSNPARTVASGNTVTVDVQTSQAVGATDATKIGLAAFNSANFTVDANGFVSLAGGGATETLTGDSGVATPAGGTIVVTGGTSGAFYTGSGNHLTTTFNYLSMAATSNTGNGVITFAANPTYTTQIHTYNGSGVGGVRPNFFAGDGAGNFTNASNGGNIGIGNIALTALTSSIGNVAIGHSALASLTSGGGNNTVLGFEAGTFLGSGTNNVLVGVDAGLNYTGAESGNLLIGSAGVLGESNIIRIGGVTAITACYIKGINGVNVGSVARVVTEASDQLGTATITAGTGITITPTANTITISTNGSSTLNTLTGNSGGAISPTAGNINTLGTGSITIAGAGSTLTTQLTGLTNHNILLGAGTATVGLVPPTANTGAVLQNNSGADPTYSTATYPSTTTINQILYSSAANTVSGLATANNGVLTTGTSGTPVITALGTDGQVIVGSSAGAPAAATLTAGAGIAITNGHNSITIAATGAGFTWSDNSGTFTAVKENGYFITATSTATLPSSPSEGDTIAFIVDTAQILTITGNTGQKIRIGAAISGAAGTAANNAQGDAVTLVYRSTGTTWFGHSVVGTWTVT